MSLDLVKASMDEAESVLSVEARDLLVMHFLTGADDVWSTTSVLGVEVKVRRQASFLHLTYNYVGERWAITFVYGLKPEIKPFRAFFAGDREAFDRDIMLFKVALV